jgi:hypothetical protein
MSLAIRKAQPAPSDVHISRPLTNISVAWIQSQTDFVSDKVFPHVPVAKQSDLYRTYDRGDWLRSVAERRAPGTESAGGGFTLGQDNYFAHVYAIHKDVDDDTRANSDAGINVDRDATEWVTQQLLMKREEIWAANYFGTGVWAAGLERAGVATGPTGTQYLRWDAAGSTPINDIQDQIVAMKALTGFKPNSLVVSMGVDNALRNHLDVIDRYKYTQAGIITGDLLARVFGVSNYHIAQAVRNTAVEGATDAFSFILGNHALLCYSNPRPSLLTPSAGYTFGWTGRPGSAGQGVTISRFRKQSIKSDRVEGEMAFDSKLVSTELGAFFLDAIS